MRLIARRCHHRLFYATQLRAVRKARAIGGTWSQCERCTHWIVTERVAA
jgi:hypothetical protein